MPNVPFKVKGGIDSNMQRVRKVADPVEDYDAINKKYFDEHSQSADLYYIYVNDVITNEISLPVTIVFKNGIFVETAESASTDIDIKILFNKERDHLVLPNVQYTLTDTDELVGDEVWTDLFTLSERQNINYNQVTHVLTNGTLTILDSKSDFSFLFNQNGLENKYYWFRIGTLTSYKLQAITLEEPVIELASYHSDYTGTQTELRNGQTVVFEVTSDVNITAVEVRGTYITSDTETKGGSNTTETITTTITGAPNNTDTASNAFFEIRVRDANNTWSQWYNSQTGGSNTEGVDYMKANNSSPSISSMLITYNNSLTALDATETADVSFTLDYIGSGSVVFSDVASNFSNINKSSNTLAIVTANNNLYRYATNTLQITATRANNGQVTTTYAQVNIASINPTITSFTPLTMRSGSGAGYATTFNVAINQRITARGVTLPDSPSGITVSNQGTLTNSGSTGTINNGAITIQDSATKGNFPVRVTVTNLAGREVFSDFTVSNTGFVSRTLTAQDLTSSIAIPMVTTPSKVKVQVGDNSNLVGCIYFNGDTGQIWSSGFQGEEANQHNEFQIFLNTGVWYIVFDNNVIALASSGGWITNARILIEEEL